MLRVIYNTSTDCNKDSYNLDKAAKDIAKAAEKDKDKK